MDTNFYGVVNVTRAAVPLMREQRSGFILQISSVGGRLTRPGSTPYHAAKWAVGGFTESLAQELTPANCGAHDKPSNVVCKIVVTVLGR
jgi:NAD(P)-dependent dehydrogenase (short-subunit alcohol dehydrogenase family)